MPKLATRNSQLICGLDEVGRGCLAGPLVACGVIIGIPHPKLLSNLSHPPKDSKLLTPKHRQMIFDELNQIPEVVSELSIIPVSDIDNYGIQWANRQAFINIITKLKADKYIIDGNLNFKSHVNCLMSNVQVVSQIKADNSVLEVSLASIIAKVHRDRIMQDLHSIFPDYGWDTNVGYGTRKHLQALFNFGNTIHHRQKFTSTAMKNLKAYLDNDKL